MFSQNSQCASPVKVGPAKKRRKSVTNLDECIICQIPKSEGLRVASETALHTLVRAAVDRRDEVHERVQAERISDIQNQRVVWHRGCFQKYISKTNIACAQKNSVEMQQSISVPSVNVTKAEPVEFNIALCMFCQRVTCMKEKTLHKINPESGLQAVFKAAEEKKDEELKTHISSLNNRTDFLKYHLKCYRSYTDIRCKAGAPSLTESFTNAFTSLVKEIDEHIFVKGSILQMKTLVERYAELLGDNTKSERFRTDNLQKRLKNIMGIEFQYMQDMVSQKATFFSIVRYQ